MTLSLLVLLTAVSAAAPAAKAAPAHAAKKSEPAAADPNAKAKELFASAQKLYAQARYTEAIAKFEEAYLARPHPVILFNIGKCWEQLGETAKALRSYRDYLRLSPDATDKETVSDAVANLERRLKEKGVQQLLVFADPQNARIEVDGKVLGTSPSSVELTAGNHTLAVKLDGYEPVERAFVMSVQRATEMTITLRPVGSKPADAPVAEKPVTTTPTVDPGTSGVVATREQPKKGGRVLTYVAGGVAVAGLGTGIALGLVSSSAQKELTGSQHDRPAADALVSRANSMALGANIAYGVAGAALVTAVVLFIVEGR